MTELDRCKSCGKLSLPTPMRGLIVQRNREHAAARNSLVQGILQGIFFCETRKLQILPKKRPNGPSRREGCRELREFLLQVSDGFGVTSCFATEAARLSGKKQGMPQLTVHLSPMRWQLPLFSISTKYLPKPLNWLRRGRCLVESTGYADLPE